MTDHQKVYTEVLRTLKDLLRGQKQGYVVTLAIMITDIVMSKKAQLSVMGSEVQTCHGLEFHSLSQENIDRTHRWDKSLFRLGLDWFKHHLKWGWP